MINRSGPAGVFVMDKTSENAICTLVSGQCNHQAAPDPKEWHGRVDNKPGNSRVGSDNTNRRKM